MDCAAVFPFFGTKLPLLRPKVASRVGTKAVLYPFNQFAQVFGLFCCDSQARGTCQLSLAAMTMIPMEFFRLFLATGLNPAPKTILI